MTKQWSTDDLFDMYVLLKNRPWQQKERIKGCQYLLEHIYYQLNEDHWKVVRIQKDAYDFMINNIITKRNGDKIISMKNNGVKLQRAHINSRRKIFTDVMNGNWNNGDEIYEFIKSKDICCLSLKNTKVLNESSDEINVPKELNLFYNSDVGMRTPGLREIEFLNNYFKKT